MSKLPIVTKDLSVEDLDEAINIVEDYGDIILRVVDELVFDAIDDLENLVYEIKEKLKHRDDLTVDDLNYYIATLPVYMYYTGDMMEDIGIKADSSEAIRREKYHRFYETSTGKTIKDKEADSAKRITDEALIEAAYTRAYKKVKGKLEFAENILTSLKKVLQWRISELETTGHNAGTIAPRNQKGRRV